MLLELLNRAEVLNGADTTVWQEALRVSGIGMSGVFFVMGLFATMILALTTLFPEEESP
jgi:hypothetical protein